MTTRTGVFKQGVELGGAYGLDQLLGGGSDGTVYQATQKSTGQKVAVKVLRFEPGMSPVAAERRRQRFRREMKICGKLAHPDIVRLIDFGDDGDLLYSVFELVKGTTLSQVLKRDGALTVRRCAELGRQLLAALEHAHGQGVIHRDLKPGNLMVLDAGQEFRLKVLDFGVSAIQSKFSGAAMTRLTLTKELVGTPMYSAPEQLRGETPSPATDLFACGLILLECLTGVNPLADASLGEVVHRRLSPAPTAMPAQLQNHALGVVLRGMLERQVSRRTACATEVLTRLDAISETDLSELADSSGYFVDRELHRLQVGLSPAVAETQPAVAVGLESERRQVTALCCRVTVQGPASAEAELIEAYRQDTLAVCRSTAQEFGGFAAGGLGNFALYYFGVPRARDIDARMAVRASLELSARVSQRSQASSLQNQVRVTISAGLHTGMLNVASGAEEQDLLHGPVAVAAASLAAHASDEETSILVDESFRQRAARFAQFTSVPEELESSVHRLHGETLSGLFPADAAPMVGRTEQLDVLLSAWVNAEHEPAFILIRGEAGLGKSRLMHEFRVRARERGHEALRLSFLPEMEHLAFGPLYELVITELGLPARPTPSELASALRTYTVEHDAAVVLLCTWMSIDLVAPYEPLPFSPQKQRAMLDRLLVAVVTQLLRRRKGYVLVEDLHWADPSSLAWLEQLFVALKEDGGFVLLSARPEFNDSWSSAYLTSVELSPLAPEETSQLVAQLRGGAELTSESLDSIVARADGIPLFAEELAHMFSEEQGELNEEVVPTTLRDLMMSRLDRLGQAKHTAQYAAAIGREFDRELLFACVNRDEAALMADLDQLLDANIIAEQRQVRRRTYVFRHALLRDAAYESLTGSASAYVHGAVADALLADFPSRIEIRPDLGAMHLERSGRHVEAMPMWLQAGQQGARSSALSEALAFYDRGLAAAAEASDHRPCYETEVALLNAKGAALIAKFGYGVPEVESVFVRANERLDHISPDSEAAFWARKGIWAFNYIKPDLDYALRVGQALYAHAAESGNAEFIISGTESLIQSYFWRGAQHDAVAQYERCMAHYDKGLHRVFIAKFGNDPFLAAVAFSACALVLLGRVDDAVARGREAIEMSREVGYPSLISGTLGTIAALHLWRGLDDPHSEDIETAHTYLVEALEIATANGFPFWEANTQTLLASVAVVRGEAQAEGALAGAIEMWRAGGAGIGRSWQLTVLASGKIQRGEFVEALAVIEEAETHVETSHEGFYQAELLRQKARALRGCGEKDAARATLDRALTLARAQDIRLTELRCARDLCVDYQTPRAAMMEVAGWWRREAQGADLGLVQETLALLT